MRHHIAKAPLVAAIALLTALAIPAAAQAHTSKATVVCDGTVTLNFTSFANGANKANYEIGVNGATPTTGSKSWTGTGTSATVPVGQLFNGDRVVVTTWWTASDTSDHHQQAKTKVLDETIAKCGDKPPPPPPVYDCDGNELPPGTTPPTPEECNPAPPPPGDTPPADTPPAGTPPADTPPSSTPTNTPATGGDVLPESVVSGRAGLRGPSGCVKQAFRARVTGRSIQSVTFHVDGKRVKKVTGGPAAFRVNPNRYGFGRHRLVAVVRFRAETGTPARRLPLTFARCARQQVAPQFTG